MNDVHEPVVASRGGIRLRDVTKCYGSVSAVRDLNLEILPGSYTCLLGPSGCGKTTTLRMIAGHETITAGEIWIGDRQVNQVAAAQRDTAMVFQNYALFPHKTVWENVSFGLKMRRLPRAEQQRRTAEILALVGLEDLARRKPSQLSGGQQQRVALARALVLRPQVVLLDEPLSALDESLRVRTRTELRKLQQQFGMTFVQVTHAQDEAFSLSDQVVVMDQGRIDQVGKPQAIFNRPASRFVAQFVGDNNILTGVVKDCAMTATAEPQVDLWVDGIGLIRALGHGAVVGAPGACCIRSDRLQVVTPNTPDHHLPNRLEARVNSIEFTGFISRVSLQLESHGLELLLKIRTDDWSQISANPGDQLQLACGLEDCIFLPH